MKRRMRSRGGLRLGVLDCEERARELRWTCEDIGYDFILHNGCDTLVVRLTLLAKRTIQSWDASDFMDLHQAFHFLRSTE
jgi:hypothetical protein